MCLCCAAVRRRFWCGAQSAYKKPSNINKNLNKKKTLTTTTKEVCIIGQRSYDAAESTHIHTNTHTHLSVRNSLFIAALRINIGPPLPRRCIRSRLSLAQMKTSQNIIMVLYFHCIHRWFDHHHPGSFIAAVSAVAAVPVVVVARCNGDRGRALWHRLRCVCCGIFCCYVTRYYAYTYTGIIPNYHSTPEYEWQTRRLAGSLCGTCVSIHVYMCVCVCLLLVLKYLSRFERFDDKTTAAGTGICVCAWE